MRYLKHNEALFSSSIDMKWLNNLLSSLNVQVPTTIVDKLLSPNVKAVWKCRYQNIDFHIAFSLIPSGSSSFLSRGYVRAMFYYFSTSRSRGVPFHTIESKTNSYKTNITVENIIQTLNLGVRVKNKEDRVQVSNQEFIKNITNEDLSEALVDLSGPSQEELLTQIRDLLKK